MRISLKQWLTLNEYTDTDEALQAVSADAGAWPALCDEGCEVEPDGTCPHGAPSILMALEFV